MNKNLNNEFEGVVMSEMLFQANQILSGFERHPVTFFDPDDPMEDVAGYVDLYLN